MANVRNTVTIPVGTNQSYSAEFVSFNGLNDDKEHIALVFKGADKKKRVPLVRLHSECLTGDVFHSARCDCGKQLDEAIESMAAEGGILLYLRQEGRGIGLYNKLDAYRLQDTGMNTFEANRALGFEDDMRDFSVAAQMLNALGINEIDLLTNNPEKVATIEEHDIKVREQRSTGIFYNRHNGHYLQAKAEIARHNIDFSTLQSRVS